MVWSLVIIFVAAAFLAFLAYLAYQGRNNLLAGVMGVMALVVLAVWGYFTAVFAKSRWERKRQLTAEAKRHRCDFCDQADANPPISSSGGH